MGQASVVMSRSISPVVLLAVLCAGCASAQTALPPGEDWHQLVATIATRGQEGGPAVAEPEPTKSSVMPRVVKTSARVGETCLVFGGVGALAALGKGQNTLGG
jgi:hypothetical protein